MKKKILGIYIHNLKDRSGLTSAKGQNPFSLLTQSHYLEDYDPSISNTYNDIVYKISSL
jgi:hypothetical protein